MYYFSESIWTNLSHSPSFCGVALQKAKPLCLLFSAHSLYKWPLIFTYLICDVHRGGISDSLLFQSVKSSSDRKTIFMPDPFTVLSHSFLLHTIHLQSLYPVPGRAHQSLLTTCRSLVFSSSHHCHTVSLSLVFCLISFFIRFSIIHMPTKSHTVQPPDCKHSY